LKSIPILVITAQDNKVASSMLRQGANAYLTKPIEFDALTKAISDLHDHINVAGSHH
jgi:response regulator of citrate/malate metabolism